MSKQDIIRAWKDKEFRNSLSEVQRSKMPANPAGILEMSESALEMIVGGKPGGGGGGTGCGTGNNCTNCNRCSLYLSWI